MPAIALLVEPGSTPSSVALSLDIFRVADRFSADDPFALTLFSAAGGEVALSPSLHLETIPLPRRLKGFDALILPGFFAADMQELSSKLETQWRPAIARLAALEGDPLVAASCYGTFVSVDQIAGEVGYADAASFRRIFTRLTSETPAGYRRRFRSSDNGEYLAG